MPLILILVILLSFVTAIWHTEPNFFTVVSPAPEIERPNPYHIFWFPLALGEPHKNLSVREIECLAKNIFFEASTEDTLGKYAVAQVSMNRLRTRHWGTDLCNVIYASHQFSWTRDARKRNSRPGVGLLKGYNWDHSMEIARDVADGRYMTTMTTALWYHADHVRPNWRDPDGQLEKIGRHIFYHRVRGTKLTLDGSGVL